MGMAVKGRTGSEMSGESLCGRPKTEETRE